MKIVYSDIQKLHNPTHEIHRSELVPAFESPERVDLILDEIQRTDFGEVVSPPMVQHSLLQRVHSQDYLSFMEQCYSRWQSNEESDKPLFPHVWRRPDMACAIPEDLIGRLGYYSFDVGTPIVEGTWKAAVASASTAAYGAEILVAARDSAFALCRPPGHHAAADYYGGYCFLNNAAIAAQNLVDQTGKSVAILDVDYHHGNGTQAIFYGRKDVLFISIHADPLHAYPYFSGHASECGEGNGSGFNVNVPLPMNTSWSRYAKELSRELDRIRDFDPEYLVVSLGVDTYENDPISTFTLTSSDFYEMGTKIADLKRSTLFVLEGGYAVSEIGKNVVSVLKGFEKQQRIHNV